MKRHASVIVPRLSRSIRTQFNTSFEPHERAPGIVDGWGLGLTTPRQLVQYLDSFVVGQERAKKILSVAVFNHYNRVRANLQTLEDSAAAAEWRDADTLTELRVDGQGPSRATFQPHPQRRLALPHLQPRQPVPLFEKSNVLIIGPTGSGKTLLSKTLARILDVPFATSDATSLTQAGYVGEDVESVIQRLLQAANWDPRRASMGIVHIDEADKLARRSGSSSDAGRDVGGEGVQQALLRMLEGTIVNVKGGGLDTNAHPPSGSTSHPFSGSPDESTSPQSSSPSGSKRKSSSPSSSAPPKTETYQVDTSDVLFILSGAFVGLDKIVKNRISKGSIGFGATLASKGDNISLNNKSGTSPTGVNFMPFFTPNEKGKNVDTLDLAEPTDLIKFGFIPEFTSRLPTTAVLHPLSTSDLLRVLTEVRGALVKQYEALFSYAGIEIRFTTPALREICEIAKKRGGGARGLRGIMENLLLEPMYECPGSSIRYVLIDQSVVRGENPAHYWTRGESAAFYSMIAAEEARDAQERSEAEQEAALSNEDNEQDSETTTLEEEGGKRSAGTG